MGELGDQNAGEAGEMFGDQTGAASVAVVATARLENIVSESGLMLLVPEVLVLVLVEVESGMIPSVVSLLVLAV